MTANCFSGWLQRSQKVAPHINAPFRVSERELSTDAVTRARAVLIEELEQIEREKARREPEPVPDDDGPTLFLPSRLKDRHWDRRLKLGDRRFLARMARKGAALQRARLNARRR